MASATVDIDVEDYIDEISDYTLIRELNTRVKGFSKREKDLFKETLQEFEDTSDRISCVESLDDNIKFEAFKQGFKNKTVAEVEKFFGC